MAPLKPTLKRLVGWANGLTECFVCHKYYWLLNTKDHYKNQHPGQQVPEVNEGTVQRQTPEETYQRSDHQKTYC